MPFLLRPDDRRLMAPALRLGDWLLQHPAATAEQRHAIARMQAELRRLPDDSPDIRNGEDSFAIVPADLSSGIYRLWTVSLSRPAIGAPGVLEIYNHYTTLPPAPAPGLPAPVHGDLAGGRGARIAFLSRSRSSQSQRGRKRGWLDGSDRRVHESASRPGGLHI